VFRKLQALEEEPYAPPVSSAAPVAAPESKSGGSVKLLAIVVVVLAVVAGWFVLRDGKAERLARDLTEKPILLHGPRDYHELLVAEELLRIKGFDYEVAPVDLKTLPRSELFERMTDAGLVSGTTGYLPAEIGGELVKYEVLYEALQHHPNKSLRERKRSYIVVYGPRNCPKTDRVTSGLKQASLPYEYRDVNDSRYAHRFEARLRTFKQKEFEWPLVDVNGQLAFSPTIEDIRSRYR
jgi:glutaredoxin